MRESAADREGTGGLPLLLQDVPIHIRRQANLREQDAARQEISR